jgi:hypothetical protein
MGRIFLIAAIGIVLVSCGNQHNPDPYTRDSTAGKTSTVSGVPDSAMVHDSATRLSDSLNKPGQN